MPELECRILVVDDEADARDTIAGLLADEGFAVVPAASRAEALARLAEQSCRVAVVDMSLDPADDYNRDGLTLMHDIKRIYPHVPVIILTGHAHLDAALAALRHQNGYGAPAFDFLTKPPTAELITCVRSALLEQELQGFSSGLECELMVVLEPGDRLRIRTRGCLNLAQTSGMPLPPESELKQYIRWADEEIVTLPQRRLFLKHAGQDLHRLLFEQQNTFLTAYHHALGRVSKPPALGLLFESSREMVGLPLEFLNSPAAGEYLALLHPLARQVRGIAVRRERISAEFIRDLAGKHQKLRVLLIASNTRPYTELIDQTGEDLARLFRSVSWLDLTYVPTEEATYDHVSELLSECCYHVVQYVGHGKTAARGEDSALPFWEGRGLTGQPKPLTAQQLGLKLRASSEVRFAHLTCCYGAATGDARQLQESDYLGLADAVLQAGVPSVLGYRWEVPAAQAREMTLAFYRSFLRHASLDLALLNGRQALAAGGRDDLVWASPILITS